MNIIYVGQKFYNQSGSIMSSMYTEDDKRMDYGFLQIALENGEEVFIRQATAEEFAFYQKKLDKIVASK